MKEILEGYSPSNILDARGLPIYPGFIDSHAHLFELGIVKIPGGLDRHHKFRTGHRTGSGV